MIALRTKASRIFAVVVVFSVYSTLGCGTIRKIEQTVVTADEKVQKVIDELQKGNKSLSDIKAVLEGLKNNLDNGEYKNQVEEIVGRAENVVQIGGESFIDFVRTRAIEDLGNLKSTILHQPLMPRKPILANAQMPAVDYLSPSRGTVTVVGWNLDQAEKAQESYYLSVENEKKPARKADKRFVAFQGQYAVTINVSQSDGLLEHFDKKMVFAGFDPAFEILVINSQPKRDPPPVTITEAYVRVNTTQDDKDREIAFTYTIHLDGVGARHDAPCTQGQGEVWGDPSIRTFTIGLNRPIPEAERTRFQLRVRYDSSNGDPAWVGRVSVSGKTSDGRQIEILSETGDFEMGHHDGGSKRDHIEREFKFNK